MAFYTMSFIYRVLLIISYTLFVAWVFYYAGLYKVAEGIHWIFIGIGAITLIFSWIIYQIQEKKRIDPFGLPDDLQTEKPEQTSFMVCFAIYALIGLGAFWYFAIA